MYESDVAETLIDLLQLRAASDAATCGYAYYADNGNRLTLPVDALDRRARAIGAALQRVSRPGDRALLAYPPGLDFISAFFGCVFAGVLPVPATYPKPRRLTPRLSAIAADCQATLALTNAQTLETLDQARASPELAALDWLRRGHPAGRRVVAAFLSRYGAHRRDFQHALQWVSDGADLAGVVSPAAAELAACDYRRARHDHRRSELRLRLVRRAHHGRRASHARFEQCPAFALCRRANPCGDAFTVCQHVCRLRIPR